MFQYPATEVFKGSTRRVVWSAEEYEAALLDGHTDAPTEEPAVDLAQDEPHEQPVEDKPARKCSKCGKPGHQARTCPEAQ